MKGLQIDARTITNRGSLRDFKSEQKYYKLWQRLQTGTGIPNRCRTTLCLSSSFLILKILYLFTRKAWEVFVYKLKKQ